MGKITYLISLMFIISSSCITENEVTQKQNHIVKQKNTDSSESKKGGFLSYFNQIKPISKNIIYDSKAILKTSDLESKYSPEGGALLGAIDFDSKCKYIIYTYPADIRLPILEVYNEKGRKVNELQLFDYSFSMQNENNYSTFKLIANDKMVLNNYSSVLIKSDTINLLNLCDGIIIETENLLNEVTSRSDTINKSINETDSILNVIENDSTSRNNIDNTFEF